jgi:Fic family protein
MTLETVQRIEPARLEEVPEAISNNVADIAAESAKLGSALNPKTAASLADMVRIMNTYYSNLIEGHATRPRDIESALARGGALAKDNPSTVQIERALQGDHNADPRQRNLLREALAHVRVQRAVDRMQADGKLGEPASQAFITWLHREFYRDASPEALRIRSAHHAFAMQPGTWRSGAEQDVAVGRHMPPASDRVPDFMTYFAERYRFDRLGKAARILAIPAAHHRFNYIHPFPDGNGRVSRLMSHAMAHQAGIGAHGLWSISRGLARGLESRSDYKRMMDHADLPRQGDLDGRGNLSRRALIEFTAWFLGVCLDQIRFMAGLFDIDALAGRLRLYVERSGTLKPEAALLLEEALVRGEFERGSIGRITGLPERTARRVLGDLIAAGLLSSDSPKGQVSLRFPMEMQDVLFPRLFTES